MRGDGNASNIPLDGTQGISMGDATWFGAAPTTQTILLHIVDPAVCAQLYPSSNGTGNLTGAGPVRGGLWGHGGWGHGGQASNPGGCFVYPAQVNTKCSTPGSAPSALRVSVPSPATTAPAGSNLSVGYQLEIANYSWYDHGTTIYLPSLNVHFPISGGGEFSFYFAPSNVTISSSGWTSVIGQAKTLPNATTFTSAAAWLTSSNLALMFDGRATNLTLEFQWGWILNASGTLSAQWSSPSTTATSPDYPSIFSVAPYVYVVSTANVTASGGSFFWVQLGGAVGKTSFKTLVETPTGVELHCQMQTNPSGGHRCGGWWGPSTFTVGVPLTYYNMTALPAGKYLIHIHDQMGAIVKQVQVTVT